MSRVFIAEELALGRRVVVKTVPPEVAGTVNFERFLREIQVAAGLQHAHIVPVLTAGNSNGIPYYTMPFVEGQSLRDRLMESGVLQIGDAISILRDVARALAYAHDHNVVHRDIKPDNVLLSGGSAVVTDFGIAKAIAAAKRGGHTERDDRSSAALTSIGTSIGTPAYMSPEQAAGDPASDHRSDIYSFGCLAYELLAGRPPFASKSPQRLLAAHMSETPLPVSDLRPDTPHALATIIGRTLEKDPDRRPQSAAELLRVLDGTVAMSAQEASQPIVLPAPRMFAKALALYAVAFVAVIGLAKLASVFGAPPWVVTWAAVLMALGLPTVLATGLAHHATRRILSATPTQTPGGTMQIPGRGRMESLAIQAGHRLTWRGAALGGIASVTILVAITTTLMLLGHVGVGPLKSVFSTGAMKASDQIVIGAITVTNADTSLGPVVELGVRTQLSDSKVIRVVSEANVAGTIRQMRLEPPAKLTPAVAIDLAKRVGAKAVLNATLTGTGTNRFIISLQLVSSDSGRQLAAVQASTSADGLVDAIGTVTKQIRARIGESLRTVNEAPALSSVTTSSIDALRAFTEGRRALLRGDAEAALTKLQTAVRLDSTFASAWRSLRAAIGNSGGAYHDQYNAMVQAHRYADRLPPAERDLVEEQYYASVKLDRATALRMRDRSLAAGDTVNINNLARRYASLRDFATAEALLRAEIRRDTGYALVLQRARLVTTLLDDGKVAEADSIERAWKPRLPNAGSAHLDLEYQRGGAAAYRRSLDSIGKEKPGIMPSRLAMLALLEGRVNEWARSRSARASSPSPASGLDSVIARAWPVAVILDQPQRMVRELDSAAAKVALSSMWEFDRPDVDLATAYAFAGSPERAEAILAKYQREVRDSGLIRFQGPRIQTAMGEIFLAKHKPLDAIKAFRAGDVASDGPVDECTICLPARMARAFDQAQMPDSAIAMFEAYMSSPAGGRMVMSRDPSQLGLYSERLAQLYDAKGESAKAVKYYQKFVELWKSADPELQPRVVAARARLARLSDSEKRL
jgi:eukaryotic-like serine/threonine-protein kinase